ncbi:MAG: glutamate racemase [Oscillospiraceae bacterium]|nr:glutamate racemase [Oscillospiraceae bacterium]
MDNRPIGIVDSGVGGLTAVRRLTEAAPSESIVYLGDNLRAPYGDRERGEIRFLSRRNARFLRSHDIKALIVACNTSTANALAELTADNADIPTVGTVGPAAAEAVRVTAGGRVGIIATTATIRSGLYERTVKELMPEAEVIARSCPRLVPLIEAGHIDPGDPALMAALEEDLEPLKAAAVDTVVLGCTHYPLITGAVRAVMERETALVDSGAACVGEVLRLLAARDGLARPGTVRTERYFCTGRRGDFTAVARSFLGRSIEDATREVDVTPY